MNLQINKNPNRFSFDRAKVEMRHSLSDFLKTPWK
jgi:hypothetical protein